MQAIAHEETRIGTLIDGDDPASLLIEGPTLLGSPLPHFPALRALRPAWSDDEPATVCEYREQPLPKPVKAPSRPAVSSPPRLSMAPAVSELLEETEPPLVLRVPSIQLAPQARGAADVRSAAHCGVAPAAESRQQAAPVETDKTAPKQRPDHTSQARAFVDRLPGVTLHRVQQPTVTPHPVTAQRGKTPSRPRVRVPGPEDTILESLGLLGEELAGFHEVTPNRYIATVITPSASHAAYGRNDTHLLSVPPLQSVSFASVTLSVFLGVMVTLAVLYHFL